MAEELKAKARRIWEEIIPSADVKRLAEVIAEDGIDHSARPDEPQGLAGVQQTVLWLGRVFSDQRWEIHQVIGEGDTVVVYCTLHGRHTGDLMGIPPTNREIAMDYVHICASETARLSSIGVFATTWRSCGKWAPCQDHLHQSP